MTIFDVGVVGIMLCGLVGTFLRSMLLPSKQWHLPTSPHTNTSLPLQFQIPYNGNYALQFNS
jgi:hypothetical protein